MKRAPRLALVALLALGGCRQDMHDQPRLEALEKSEFFEDGRASRPRVPGTVARDEGLLDELLVSGRIDGKLSEVYPLRVDRELLERGRERYAIYCTPCHGGAGYGRGVIVERGMKRPQSFHSERLREAPPGYYVEVIAQGFGAMFDYADCVPPRDRWAIAAWIEVLQKSQWAEREDAPEDALMQLEEEAR